ncbi:ABC transporter ATP-binding protein, partial [uncultured Olegusella sp.]|uniref:ABC transporter ATP-binding protein n=1 Tax=uncultured Olegusella sp. TaxID=1979846 RepID=UPI00262779EF
MSAAHLSTRILATGEQSHNSHKLSALPTIAPGSALKPLETGDLAPTTKAVLPVNLPVINANNQADDLEDTNSLRIKQTSSESLTLSGKHLLDLRDVFKTYGIGEMEVPVLHNINLTVDDGEYVAIMGPSGSGKSTLMNIIGCLDVVTKGTYLLDGTDVSNLSDDAQAQFRNRTIGFVFQNFNLMPRETAVENVALPMIYAGIGRAERRERAYKALERVGLADRAEFLPTKLSGGQCQRVAIARAIVMHPRLLLADEPTGALDSVSGKQVMELFAELNASGMAVVMITHDPTIADHA